LSVFRRLLLLSAAIWLLSMPTLAITPERGLENPVFLAEMDQERLLYGSYALDLGEFLVSYAEYDVYARGHGAFLLRGGGDADTTVSFIGTREMEGVNLGLGLHRVSGTETQWLLDLGASYQKGSVAGRAGVHNLPFTQWKELPDHRDVSVGASVYLSEAVILGMDVKPFDGFTAQGHLMIVVSPDLRARVYVVHQDAQWESAGADGWYRRGDLLFHLGYRMRHDRSGYFRFGIGFSF